MVSQLLIIINGLAVLITAACHKFYVTPIEMNKRTYKKYPGATITDQTRRRAGIDIGLTFTCACMDRLIDRPVITEG